MNGKLKTTAAALLLAAMIPTVTVRASGIPVVDGAMATITQNQNIQTAIHWSKEITHMASQITHYATIVDNWKTNFQNMLRAKISDFFGITLGEKVSEQQLTAIWEKGRKRCNQISNTLSQSYCNQMIDLEIRKINLYFAGENSIDQQWKQFISIQQQYNREQSSGQPNSSRLDSLSQQMSQILSKIQMDMQNYENQIGALDTRIEFMRKARVKIAQEQMQGTNRTVIDNISKAAVIITLETSRQNSKSKANQLREANRSRSAAAFGSRM